MLWEWIGSPSNIPSEEEEVKGKEGEEVDEKEKGEEEKKE